MSDKFHINPETGNPNKCTAKIKCRFGSDSEHFDSKDAAREFFEKSKSGATLTTMKKSATDDSQQKLSPSLTITVDQAIELKYSKDARNSIDPEILDEVAEFGTDRNLSMLAGNRYATAENIVKAFERVENFETKLRLQTHHKFPTDKLTPHGMRAIYNADTGLLGQHCRSNGLTDEAADGIPSNERHFIGLAVGNPNNKLSQEKLIELAETSPHALTKALTMNPNYPAIDRVDSYKPELAEYALRYSSDPDVLRKLLVSPAGKYLKGTFQNEATMNKNLPADSLQSIAETAEREDILKHIWNHPNSTESTRKLVKSKNSSAATPYKKSI